jgi:hypothetical protein
MAIPFLLYSEQQKQIFEILKSEGPTGLLVNPHGENISTLIDTCEQEKQNLLDSESIELNPLIPPVPPAQALSEILGEKIDEFIVQIELFRAHTNRQSIIVSTNGIPPVVPTYLGVSIGIQNLELSLGNTQEAALQRGKDLWGNFYYITDTTFIKYKSFIETITLRFESNQPGEEIIDQQLVEDTIDQYIAELADQMAEDNANYNSALSDLNNSSLMFALIPILGSVPDVIITEKIGNEVLNGILEEIPEEDR